MSVWVGPPILESTWATTLLPGSSFPSRNPSPPSRSSSDSAGSGKALGWYDAATADGLSMAEARRKQPCGVPCRGQERLIGVLKNAKAKGARRERRTRDWLLSEEPEGIGGYQYVIKAGGSLGMFDLVAIGWRGVLLVQVKSNGLPPPKERALISAARVPSFCKKEIWVWYDRRPEPRIIEVD